MPVSTQETVFHHVGNGITVTFAYGCQVLQYSDLLVYLDNVLLGTGFSVSGIGAPSGGAVTFDTPPRNQSAVRLERVIALERLTDYQQNGDFLARVVNPDFNRLWMALQQHLAILNRALLTPKSDQGSPSPLPSIAMRANKLLSFDASGNPVAVMPQAQSASALQVLLATEEGSGLIGHGSGSTIAQALAALDDVDARLSASIPATRSSRAAFIEQHITGFFGRGMLTAEQNNIVSEQSLAGAFLTGAATLVVADASKFVAGGCATIKHDNGRYHTYFIDSKSGNNLGIRPRLRADCATAAARIERTWFNRAHPGKFYMRELAQRVVYSTEIEAAMPNGRRALCTNFSSNPNTVEDTLIPLGNATVNYYEPENIGQDGIVSPVRFGPGRGAYVENLVAASDGAKTAHFEVFGMTNSVVKVAFYASSVTTRFSIQIFDESDQERGKYIVPSDANNRVEQIYTFPADLRGAKQAWLRVAVEDYVAPGGYFVISQIDVFDAPENSGRIISNPAAKIVHLGDSWSQGDLGSTPEREPIWHELARQLPEATIIGAGVGGNKVSEMLARFDADVAVHRPDYVIINSGTNECYSPLSGVFLPNAVDEYLNTWRRLLNRVAEIGARPIIIGTPALAQTDEEVPQFAEWLLNDRAKAYARFFFEKMADKPMIYGGTVANGSWHKLPDGTMIARHRVSVTTTAANTLASAPWEFPVPFVGIPHVTTSLADYATSQVVSAGHYAATGQTVSIRLVSGAGALTMPIDCVAVGRWR